MRPFGSSFERLAQAAKATLSLKPSSPLEQTRDRLMVTAAAVIVAFLAVSAKLAVATLIDPAAEPNRPTVAAEPVFHTMSRADIVDRNGDQLATSLAVSSVYADAKVIINAAEATDRLVSVLPDLDRIDTLAKLSSDKRFVWIKRNLTPTEEKQVFNLGIPGVYFQREERRVYPTANLASHVVGFTDLDNNGLAGLERGLDKRLRTEQAPIETSLDMRLQYILRSECQAALNEFSALGAAGMIYDVRNGEILAMVSLPDFDPQDPDELADLPDDQKNDPLKNPRFNRATLGVYEMGSTFKIFNSAMVLDTGKVKLSDTFDAIHNIEIGRFTITDYHGEHRMLSVADIFKVSSNLGSVRMMETVGPTAQKAFMTKMGFTRPLALENAENGWPLIPNPWNPVNAMTIAYGHGIAVTPLHVVAAAAAAINGGILYKPTLLKREAGEPIEGERVISEKTSDAMRKLFRLVVTEGTAKFANIPGYVVGGKTGTADMQVGHGYDRNARRSSFVGAFPMQAPRYIVYMIFDDPKGTKKSYGYATAGWVAVPAVGRVIARVAPILGVPTYDETAPDIRRAVEMDPTAPLPVKLQANKKGSTVASVPALPLHD